MNFAGRHQVSLSMLAYFVVQAQTVQICRTPLR